MNTSNSFFKKEFKFKGLENFRRALNSLSLLEKAIFAIFATVFIGSTLWMVWKLNERVSVNVPVSGGTLTEGIVGYPRFINPLLIVTDSDRDLSELLYSGLMRVQSDGTLAPDLAQSYTISPDGLTYTFILRNNIYFQDGTPITADDVVFTVQKAEDPAMKSPEEASWNGVTVQKVNDQTVTFTLEKPYAPFLENTTLGILPKHIWNDASADEFAFSQYNTKPIGSGPYKVSKINFNTAGVPQSYDLVPFDRYPLGTPYIDHLIIRAYSNEQDMIDAYKRGEIQSMYDIAPQEVASLSTTDKTIYTSPLPRVFGVFFNQSQAPVLANKEVRQALNMAVDRNQIIQQVLAGYGVAVDDPIPPNILPEPTTTTDASSSLAAAKALLAKNGWMPDANGILQKKVGKTEESLSFSISTPDVPELMQTAYLIQDMWKQIGADVTIKIFETGDLNQTVIRPRNYDALLFGEIVGRDMDLYAFWDSSQRNDPGLNIAGYVNIQADKLLENARTLSDPTARMADYTQFEALVRNDVPAVFLYSPDFIYILPKDIQGFTLGSVTTPAERFDGIEKWFIETDTVWKIFADNDTIIKSPNQN